MEPSSDNSFGSLGSSEGGVGGVAGANGVNGVDGVSSPVMGVSGMEAGSATLMSSGGNGTGAPMTFTAPVSSGTGDIVINGTGEKRSKKGLFVGLMVLVALLVIGGIAAVIMLGGGGRTSETAREKFNKLINYVVSGEESTADYMKEYDSNTSYYFDTQQENIENRAELYEKTSALLDDFMTEYNNLGDKNDFIDDTEEFNKRLSGVTQTFDFMNNVTFKQIPSNINIKAEYVAGGKAQVLTSMSSYYNFSSIKDNVYVQAFLKLFNNYVNSSLNILELFQKNGCLNDGRMDYSCMQSKNDANLVIEYSRQSDINDTAYATLEQYYTLSDVFIAGIFDLNQLVINDGEGSVR